MPYENFMISDLVACSEASLLCALFAFVPGYVLSWLMDLFAFRKRRLLTQMVMSVPMSISLCPGLTYLVGRFISMTAVWAVYASLWAGFVVLLWRRWRNRTDLSRAGVDRQILISVAITAGWVVLGIFSLVDVQVKDRLYFSGVAYDYNTRAGLTSEISRTGLPPHNPFFYPGQFVPLRYHYYWLIPSSLTDQLGGAAVSPRQALVGGTIWAGIGLLCLIPLFLRFFAPESHSNLKRRTVIGLCLLGVTGLDLVPTLILRGLFGVTFPDMEWWNHTVMAWIHAVLWVPHHIAGLVACLSGFLILWDAARHATRLRDYLVPALASGLAFSSAVGSSVYVTFVFGLFLGVWAGGAFLKKWYRDALAVVMAGLAACVMAAPYLLAVRGTASTANPVQFSVRPFSLAQGVMTAMGYGRDWQLAIVNLAFLPLNYFLELGFFLLIAVWQFRRLARKGTACSREETAFSALLLTSVLVCTFLRTRSSNDLGWRGFLPAQFVLLIWAVDYVGTWLHKRAPRAHPRFAMTLLLLGVAGSLYSVVILRAYPWLLDSGEVPVIGWMSPDRQLGRRTYALREAFEWVDRRFPATAILQNNPDNRWDLYHGLYGNRQTVAFNHDCVVGFGGELPQCEPIQSRLQALFSGATDAADNGMLPVCRALSIDVLLAKDIDGAWRDKKSWVWRRQPLFANDFARVFACAD